MKDIKVAVFIGSKSDIEAIEPLKDTFKKLRINYELKITSAHRSPERTKKLIKYYDEECNVSLFIVAAGYAAHLAGVVAAETIKPVIGIPIDSSSLNGLDSLLSTVQMPGGVPVATVTIGRAGAKNAAILAGEIIALHDKKVREKLKELREEDKKKIEKFDI